MKRFFCIIAAAAFALGTLTLVSCDKEDEEPTPTPTDSTNNNGGATASALIGTWTIEAEDFTLTYTFTETTLTRSNGYEKMEAAYTYANGNLTLSNAVYYDRQEDGSWKLTGESDSSVSSTLEVSLLQNNNVLVFRQQIPPDDYYPAYEDVICLYREGKTITVNAADLQGQWRWFFFGNTESIRAMITFNGNNYDLIVTAWCQRYKGTFTIENGYLRLTPNEYYTCAWDELDESDPEGMPWVETHLDEAPQDMLSSRMPFFVNGSESYAIFANLTGLYVKQ